MDLEKAYHLIEGKLETWFVSIIEMLPNFLLAALLVIAFALLASFIRKMADKGLQKLSISHTIVKLLATLVYVTVLSIGLFVALKVLKLDTTVTSLLAGAGIIGLALSFAFQDIATNLMSGIILSSGKRVIRRGHVIGVNDFEGTVLNIGLRATKILTVKGEIVIIPNKDIIQNPLVNYSEYGMLRVDIPVGVSQLSNMEQVSEIAKKAVEPLPFVLKDKSINVLWKEFGESSMNCVVSFWINYSKNFDYTNALSEGMVAIKKAFDTHEINLPFPIRTLDIPVETLKELLGAVNPPKGSN